MHAAVVGSGPSAIAATKALLRRGVRVTILDAGETLDPDRSQLVQELREMDPAQWPAEKLAGILDNPTVSNRQIPKKLVFGSDYIYAGSRDFWPLITDEVDVDPTFARGGYSVAWGAAMMPADDCDLVDWPIKRAELEASYKRVLSELPLSAGQDSLRERFPLYKDDISSIEMPAAAKDFQRDLERGSPTSALTPFHVGQARLAVREQTLGAQTGCKYCGMCMSSCPYGAIYTTNQDLEELIRKKTIEYIDGVVVDYVEEGNRKVTVKFFAPSDGHRMSREFDRVFVGAGAINSTRIILRSLELFDTPVTLLDSQKFVVPIARLRRHLIEWPEINSLAALFIETKLSSISDHWIHAQISVPHDLLLRRFGLDPVRFDGRTPIWLKPILERLMIAWCGLHSDHSSKMEVKLCSETQNGGHILKLRAQPNSHTRRIIRKVAWALARRCLTSRSIGLAPFTVISQIGGGSHYGGSFPMSDSPKSKFGSDKLGRPAGMTRVHIVDASIFPSIPATTMVLPMMANADRIVMQMEICDAGKA